MNLQWNVLGQKYQQFEKVNYQGVDFVIGNIYNNEPINEFALKRVMAEIQEKKWTRHTAEVAFSQHLPAAAAWVGLPYRIWR